ncbi:hypothetical protein FZC66_07425 [Priestia megaterium]|nr:hypothetical protein FZC66_07425 [Priestia megaterium]
MEGLLEYRLLKVNDTYVSLYHYESIELDEILARRECEFFVKEGVTYKQRSSAIEDDIYIIYVDEYEYAPKQEKEGVSDYLTVEIREFNSYRDYPLVEIKTFGTHLEVLSYIGAVYTYHNQKEWERDSAEIDEDRQVYVLYVQETGVSY